MTTCEKKFGCSLNPTKCFLKKGYESCVKDNYQISLHTICAIQAIFCLGQQGYDITEQNIVTCGQLLTPSLTIDSQQMHLALVRGVKSGLFRASQCNGQTVYEVCPGSVNLNPANGVYADYLRMFSSCRAVYPSIVL